MNRYVVILCAVCVLFSLSCGAYAHLTNLKICVDPGHGGSDPGAVAFGTNEKDVNLDIGLRMRDILQADGAVVIMTKTTDIYVTLQGRCDVANNAGANRFECTHCNAYSGLPNGTETFCSPTGAPEAFDLRNRINAEMVSHMATFNRGNKTNTFYVLENTTMPAILCEVAFLDNAADYAKLMDPFYRNEAARAYLHGTQSHYGVTPHEPGDPDTWPPIIWGIASVPSRDTCVVNWTTNEGSTSQVEYGLTTAYGSLTPLDSNLVTSHSITIGGLARKTTYHYRVRSTDAGGYGAVSGDYTFKTK